MSYTLVEQVKIRLKQFHIEAVEDEATGEKSDKVVFDEKECNPLIEQLLEQERKEIISRRNYPDTYTQDQIDSDVAVDVAEHVEVDVLVIFDFDDVLGAVTLGVGVHDERKLGFGRVDFQVFENLQRGSGRHMVDNDAVLNAGDFHQA